MGKGSKKKGSQSANGAIALPTPTISPPPRTTSLPSSAQVDANDSNGHAAISPNAYFTSDKGDYRMPRITEPISYLTVLWRRYEATFAISMFETVRDREAAALYIGQHR